MNNAHRRKAAIATTLSISQLLVPFSQNSAEAADATYSGPAIDVTYGTVQVQITVLNDVITAATALQSPGGSSQQWSDLAIPKLRQQTLDTQSDAIQGVSGASYTSYGWYKSLQGALALMQAAPTVPNAANLNYADIAAAAIDAANAATDAANAATDAANEATTLMQDAHDQTTAAITKASTTGVVTILDFSESILLCNNKISSAYTSRNTAANQAQNYSSIYSDPTLQSSLKPAVLNISNTWKLAAKNYDTIINQYTKVLQVISNAQALIDKAAADKAADKAAADKAAADKAAADKAAADKAASLKLIADAKLKAAKIIAAAKAKAALLTKKVTITCIKGKLVKKVTAVKPKCPAGYKKK